MFEYNTVEEAVKDLQDGKLILVSDDESRENEGDLICAAEFATTENVNFMATYGKGLICMPMSGDLCRKLGLTQMVADNTDNHETAFTVSIDHVKTTTGISAEERGFTARACVYLRRLMGEKTILEVPQEIEEELNRQKLWSREVFYAIFNIPGGKGVDIYVPVEGERQA